MDTTLPTVVNALVRHVHFPGLEHLQFDNGNIQDQSLSAFFQKHSSTLRTFTLTAIYTNFGKWPSLLTHLSNIYSPKLEKLSIICIEERHITQTDDGCFDLGDSHLMQWLIWPDLGEGKGKLTYYESDSEPFNEIGFDKLKWMAANICQIRKLSHR